MLKTALFGVLFLSFPMMAAESEPHAAHHTCSQCQPNDSQRSEGHGGVATDSHCGCPTDCACHKSGAACDCGCAGGGDCHKD